MKQRLSEFEKYIGMKARKHAYEQSDYDDFFQEGMIAAWQALDRDPKATKSYVKQAVEWRMIDFARKMYAHRETGYTPGMENMLFGNYGEEHE